MKHDEQAAAQELLEGQLWRLKRRYVQIVALGRKCVQFKMMDSPNDTFARALSSDIDILWRYLLSRKGRLV